MKRASILRSSVIAAVCLLPAMSVGAVEQGDWLVRAGWAHVEPNDDSGGLTADPTIEVGVGSGDALGLTIAYMLTPNIGVELLAASPFKHDIEAKGSLSGAGTIATVKHLPPTLSLQYYFMPKSNISPYVGLGVNYTFFFDEQTEGALAGTPIRLTPSWGVAAELGVDVSLDDNWFVNASLWYMNIDTTAKLGGGLGQVDVQIDPLAFVLGAGRRF